MSELTPRLKQVIEAEPDLRSRVLVLLARVEPHSLADLVDMLGCTRAELMAEMGALGGELVKFSRPDGQPGIHWYATAKGRKLGDDLYERALQMSQHVPGSPTPGERPSLEPVDAANSTAPRRLAGRRRVVIGEREQVQERAFSFE